MNPVNVLITGAGAPGAPGIIKSLRLVKEREVRIVGVDMNKDAVGFAMADKAHIVPKAADESFISALLAIAKEEGVHVIIPLVTRELEVLSAYKPLFEKEGIAVSVSDAEQLHIANNKFLLMDHCRKNGIPVPDFTLARSAQEFEQAVFGYGYPEKNVCFKPPASNGLRGFRVLTKSISRLDALLKEKPNSVLTSLEEIMPVLQEADPFPELLVMEYLPGDEYSVDVLADHGTPLIAIPRFREEITGGISSVGVVVQDKEIEEYSLRIVSSLKLKGNIGLQFKRDGQGVPKILESNPRVQGTIVLCTAAGANLVYLGVKVALGEHVDLPAVAWGTKMARHWEEMYYRNDGTPFLL